MKRQVFWIPMLLLLCLCLTANAEKPGDTVTIAFEITSNTQNAISARVGMAFDGDVFEFVSAEVISTDVLNTAPITEKGKFGLLNMSGIATGKIGTITLRIKESAPAGKYEIKPVVDSVYNAKRETVELAVAGEMITVDHVWDDGRVTVEATCYTEGVMTYYCFYCDEKRTETIPVTEHREGVAVVTKVATCTENGEQIYTCDICHDTLRTEILPAFGHAEGDTVVTQEATCGAEGVQVLQCANCGKTICTDSIPATGLHTEVVDSAVAATCTTAGKTEGKHCSVCGEVLAAQQVVPAKGHTEVTDKAVAPDCTNTGLTEGKHCSVCGEVLAAQQVVPAKGHSEVIDKAVAPDCINTGLTEGKHCSVCGEVLTAQQVVPAKDHSWDDGVITKEPTATEEGMKTFSCKTCAETRTESIPVVPVIRIPGDANEDGTVDIIDALLTLQYAVGWSVEINTSNANVNGDNSTDILDALLILQQSVGWHIGLL